MKISELERATQTPRSTIHFYVREGLLPQPQKTAGTRALYSHHHVVLLKRIAEAKADGRSLADIRAELEFSLKEASESDVDLEAVEFERTHGEVVRFAARQFVEKGYRRTHVADLIRDLGISSSLFYTHFPSKHHLLVESFALFMEWAADSVESSVASSGDVIERQIVRTLAGIGIHRLSGDVLALVSAEKLQTEEGLRQPVEAAWNRVIQYLSAEFVAMRGPEAPPPPIPDDMLAYALNAALQTSLTRALWDPGFTVTDVVRVQTWLWLAITAAMKGQTDANGELAKYEELIKRTVAAPPVFQPPGE